MARNPHPRNRAVATIASAMEAFFNAVQSATCGQAPALGPELLIAVRWEGSFGCVDRWREDGQSMGVYYSRSTLEQQTGE